MDKKITKISDTEVKIETTVVSSNTVTLDELNTKLENYQGYIENTTNEYNAKIAVLQSELDSISSQTEEVKGLGVKTSDEIKLEDIIIDETVIDDENSTSTDKIK